MRLSFFIFILLTSKNCCAQWFDNITAYTIQNGLSNNTITRLQKDEAGFLWAGTHEGLNRYDGTEFVNVLSSKKNHLPSNNILALCFIGNNTIVAGTDQGLCFLNTFSLEGRLITLHGGNVNFGLENYIIDILFLKDKNEIWVSAWSGVFVLDIYGSIKKSIAPKPGATGRNAFAHQLLRDKNGDVFFYSSAYRGFYYPSFEKQDLIPVEKKLPGFDLNTLLKRNLTLLTTSYIDDVVSCVFQNRNVYNGENYIACYNNKTGSYFIRQIKDNGDKKYSISQLIPLDDTLMIANSYFGEPYLYNTKNGSIQIASDKPLWFTSWPDGITTTVYKDVSGLWIGTASGLLYSSAKTAYFKNNPLLVKKINSRPGLVSYNYGMYAFGKFWLACMGVGVLAEDTASHTIDDYFDQFVQLSLQHKMVSTALANNKKEVWLFSVYGVAQIDPYTKKIGVIQAENKDSLFDETARTPFIDSKGNIWTNVSDGVVKYETDKRKFTNYKSRYSGGALPILRAVPKTEDKNGVMWMTRNDTLVKYDPYKNKFSYSLIRKNGKPIRPVEAIAYGGEDILYLAMPGLFGIYHISLDSLEIFSKQTGIVSSTIDDMISDNEGNAWLGTEGGLVFYNKKMKKFSSFTRADGLPEDEVIALNFADEEKKTLFLGFSKTYCLVEPKKLLTQKEIPVNIISNVEVNGINIPLLEKQILTYRQNNITFSYTGINFNQGNQNNYACMLEEVDKTWKYPGTERKINYINLPPGKYVFKIKSANHQGEWNEHAATFSFEITPPFWQQWWFRALAIMAVVCSVYLIIKNRESSLQRQNDVKLQMSELRMQALRAQMNPHFIFNSLNSIQNYILRNNTIDAAGYLSKFAKLIRRILDHSKHSFLSLAEIMETLKMYVEIEAFRFSNEFSYHFDIEENDDLLDVKLPPMMLQPFVENAILHGLMPKENNRQLHISCRAINGTAEIIIDDNGIGRSNHQVKEGHISQGEKLTKDMLESLKQIKNIDASLEIIDKTSNGNPSGTTVKLILPLN